MGRYLYETTTATSVWKYPYGEPCADLAELHTHYGIGEWLNLTSDDEEEDFELQHLMITQDDVPFIQALLQTSAFETIRDLTIKPTEETLLKNWNTQTLLQTLLRHFIAHPESHTFVFEGDC